MTACELCNVSPPVQYYPDVTGLLRQLCESCRSMEALRIADGSHNGKRKTPVPANENAARQLEATMAQRDALADALSSLLRAFPELATGLSSTPQQIALREARAILVEVGK